MLEPTAIHSYEPPAYKVRPPSPAEGPPVNLPFDCVVLESADANGGPSPALLHSLRERGCKLVLALVDSYPENHCDGDVSCSERPAVNQKQKPAALSREWFDAVFDKVVDMSAQDGFAGNPLVRFLTDAAMEPANAVCFASTEAGAQAFAAANAGLIIAPTFDKVWEVQGDDVHMCGADLSAPESPTARQLQWLFRVLTDQHWCPCVWLAPPSGELENHTMPDKPSAEDRAVLTTVGNCQLSATGHPPWLGRHAKSETEAPFGCSVRLGDEMVPCPDWTPMEPRLRHPRSERSIRHFPKVVLYSHSLDVGVAQVNHVLECADHAGLSMRVSSRRFVNLARAGQAAAELSVTLAESKGRKLPDICIRSGLRLDPPPGFHLVRAPEVHTVAGSAVLAASFKDATNRQLTVRTCHRFLRDDGRGEVLLVPGNTEHTIRVHVETLPMDFAASEAAVDLVFENPRRGTRYTVEKVVSVYLDTVNPAPFQPLARMFLASSPSANGLMPSPLLYLDDLPPTLPEIEEEHRSAWRTEWDRADIEIAGMRKAIQCQRAARLFRFHQVSRGDSVGNGQHEAQVPKLVRQLFLASVTGLLPEGCQGGSEACRRPSSLITSRITVYDPREPPVLRIIPKVPPACHHLMFNAALGGRWHRFTLTSGKVCILVQGPIWVKTMAQLYGNIVEVPPKFIIPSMDSGERVEVQASPWHEVWVQHALTDLGRPDGSAGGFYSLMRRTRFMRSEVLRRLLTDAEGSYKDSTLIHPLENALAGLQSVPRPFSWRAGDCEDLHMLKADDQTQMSTILSYEKSELVRDIAFLQGACHQIQGQIVDGEDLKVEVMTVQDAQLECGRIRGCQGFTFQADAAPGTAVKIHFKSSCEVQADPMNKWISYRFEDGETAVLKLLQKRYEETYHGDPPVDTWVQDRVPPWDSILQDALEVISKAVSNSESNGDRSKPFRNFITDRDGTTNNYCDRYASSVQSAYNAAWLSHFARHCTDNALFVTAAPLGGRPSAEGLMELSVAPRGVFTYTGSKGREYFDVAAQRVIETEELPTKQREVVEELHRRILALCSRPENTKFLGIGSGLQRKFGEVTMARNDPAGTVPEPESRRFMTAVRKVKEELDPDGTELDLHDTGTDMEIFPRSVGGRASFDKGTGVRRLDEKLQLGVRRGPNLVCGDTSSDFAMIDAVLRLMCGEKMVEAWLLEIEKEETCIKTGQGSMDSAAAMQREENEDLTEEEAERIAQEEMERAIRWQQEEAEAREIGSRLAVLFVISPELHQKDTKTPKLATKLQRFCEAAGAHCAILPSVDVLVASLATYANKVAGRSVTEECPSLERATSTVSLSSFEQDRRVTRCAS